MKKIHIIFIIAIIASCNSKPSNPPPNTLPDPPKEYTQQDLATHMEEFNNTIGLNDDQVQSQNDGKGLAVESISSESASDIYNRVVGGKNKKTYYGGNMVMWNAGTQRSDKPYGRNVTVVYDSFFKNYLITFDDSKGNKKAAFFELSEDELGNEKVENNGEFYSATPRFEPYTTHGNGCLNLENLDGICFRIDSLKDDKYKK